MRALPLVLLMLGCGDPPDAPAGEGTDDADAATEAPPDAATDASLPGDVAVDATHEADGAAAVFYDDDFPAGPVDRAGRPAVTLGVLEDEDLDAYNQNHATAEWGRRWTEPIADGLRVTDGLNGVVGDTLLPPEGMAVVLSREYILLNAAAPYAAEGFLDRELLFGFQLSPEEASGGGRSLSQDVVDVMLRYTAGPPATGDRWDCVEANDAPLRDVFPYVAPPH